VKKKMRKGDIYIIEWLDHCTCYYSWTDPAKMNVEDYKCESIGYVVNETKTSIFLAQNIALEDSKVTNIMQIIKSTITKIQKIKTK